MVQGDTGRMGPAVMAHMVNDHYSGVGIHAPTQFLALRARRVIEEHRLPASAVEAFIQADYYHGARNPEAMPKVRISFWIPTATRAGLQSR